MRHLSEYLTKSPATLAYSLPHCTFKQAKIVQVCVYIGTISAGEIQAQMFNGCAVSPKYSGQF